MDNYPWYLIIKMEKYMKNIKTIMKMDNYMKYVIIKMIKRKENIKCFIVMDNYRNYVIMLHLHCWRFKNEIEFLIIFTHNKLF